MAYTAGLDLAQSSEYTALILCRCSGGMLRTRRYEVVYARRWRGTSYPAVVEEVSSLLGRPPFLDDVRLNLDATGVGAPILDLFQRAKFDGLIGCQINPVIFSAGNEPNPKKNTVPKRDLVSRLEVLLTEKRLSFAPELTLATSIREELRNFGYKLSATGRASFEAAGSGHDDLISALALACHEGGGPPLVLAFQDYMNPGNPSEPDAADWLKLTRRALETLRSDDRGAVRCRGCGLNVALAPDVIGALRLGLFGHYDPFCDASFEVSFT